MTQTEGFYPGGEVGFIRDIFADQFIMMMRRVSVITNDNSTSMAQGNVIAARPPPPPPVWTASMCGHKSSWEALVHVLQATLGIAHVRTTEFGPGDTIRWFVAWTWQKPMARSPWAAHSAWDIDIDIGDTLLPNEHVPITVNEIIMQRLQDYCTWKEDWHLQVSVNEDNKYYVTAAHCPSNAPNWTLMERSQVIQWHEETDKVVWLPEPIQTSLSSWNTVHRAQYLLPPEGHFVVDIQIHPNNTTCTTTTTSGSSGGGSNRVVLSCRAYAHTLYGKRRVAQLQSHMGGELARTNRRWRRKVKLQLHRHQEKQPHQQQQGDIVEMDTS